MSSTDPQRESRPIVLGGLLLIVAFSLGWPALGHAQTAEPELVDRIVAIVDEEMILQSDLEREMEIYRLEHEYAGLEVTASDDEIRQEILERLVESKLVIAAAKQADIEIEDEAIEQGVDSKIDQLAEHFGSQEALERELLRSGMTVADYRSRLATQLRDQHYLRAVISSFIRPNVEVLENEISDYYQEHLDEMPSTPDSLTLANILVPIQPDVETQQLIQQKVGAVSQALEGGEDFNDVTRRLSEGPNAARGGSIGLITRGNLFDERLENAVFALQERQISQPIISTRGVHIVRVDALAPDGGRVISQIFFPMQVTEADVDAAEVRARDAHRRIVAGEPFSLVASEVSGDPASARHGGDLGRFQLGDLSPLFQEELLELGAGEMTEPFPAPAGFYIFLVKERTFGRQFSFEELKEDLRAALESEKMEAELARYVESLRQRFFIDLKG